MSVTIGLVSVTIRFVSVTIRFVCVCDNKICVSDNNCDNKSTRFGAKKLQDQVHVTEVELCSIYLMWLNIETCLNGSVFQLNFHLIPGREVLLV